MRLMDLKTNIQETLGMDIISAQSLVVCVNNCISVLQSKEYKEFETHTEPTNERSLPITIDAPSNKRQTVFVKVITDHGEFKAYRVPLTEPGLKSRVIDDVYRMDIPGRDFIYYEQGGKIIVDASSDVDIKEIEVGLYVQLTKVPIGTTEEQIAGKGEEGDIDYIKPAEVHIRQHFEDAFTFYGLLFYAQRFKFRPETISEYSNTFRYFVEDMGNQMDKEDMFLSETETTTFHRY